LIKIYIGNDSHIWYKRQIGFIASPFPAKKLLHVIFWTCHFFTLKIILYRIFHVKSIKNWDFSTWPSPINFFCTFADRKKQKIYAYYVFRNYRLKNIYSGTNFSRFLDSRLILLITHSSVKFCGRTQCLGRLERYFNRENLKKTPTFFLLGVVENGTIQKRIFNVFETWYTGRRLSVASFLKTIRWGFYCLESIDFWIWPFLKFSQFFGNILTNFFV
jgi:hypothetical protein